MRGGRLIALSLVLCALAGTAHATCATIPANSAALEMSGTTQALIGSATAVTPLPEGTVVYDATAHALEFCNGTIWGTFGGTPSATFVNTTAYQSIVSAAATAKMLGLGTSTYGSYAFAPARNGDVEITISGYYNMAAGSGTYSYSIEDQIYYGTGTAPTRGAAVTGTTCGGPSIWVTEGNGYVIDLPYTITCLVTGLTVGTTYWIDMSTVVVSGTYSAPTYTIVNNIDVRELP